MYRSNGYKFVSLDQALDDPAYQTAITVYGNWGDLVGRPLGAVAGEEEGFFYRRSGGAGVHQSGGEVRYTPATAGLAHPSINFTGRRDNIEQRNTILRLRKIAIGSSCFLMELFRVW